LGHRVRCGRGRRDLCLVWTSTAGGGMGSRLDRTHGGPDRELPHRPGRVGVGVRAGLGRGVACGIPATTTKRAHMMGDNDNTRDNNTGDNTGDNIGDLSVEDRAFRDALGRFASGVTIVTTVLDGVDHAMTASAVTSVALEPRVVLVFFLKKMGGAHVCTHGT